MRKLNQSLIVLPKRWKSQTGDSRSNAVLFKLIPRYCQDGEHTLHPDSLRGIVPHCEAPMREMRRSDRGSEPHVRSFPSEHASFYIIHASSGEKVQRGKKGGAAKEKDGSSSSDTNARDDRHVPHTASSNLDQRISLFMNEAGLCPWNFGRGNDSRI